MYVNSGMVHFPFIATENSEPYTFARPPRAIGICMSGFGRAVLNQPDIAAATSSLATVWAATRWTSSSSVISAWMNVASPPFLLISRATASPSRARRDRYHCALTRKRQGGCSSYSGASAHHQRRLLLESA
jgi:hypothetical protein